MSKSDKALGLFQETMKRLTGEYPTIEMTQRAAHILQLVAEGRMTATTMKEEYIKMALELKAKYSTNLGPEPPKNIPVMP